MDVAPALAFGPGARAAPALPAGHPVQRVIQAARGELLPDFYFFTAVPPVGVAVIKHVLRGWLGVRLAGVLDADLLAHAFFFLSGISSSGTISGSPLTGCGSLQLFDALLQVFHGDLALVERAALDAVRQRQFGSQGNIAFSDGVSPFEGGVRPGGLQDHQVGAMAIHIQGRSQRCNG